MAVRAERTQMEWQGLIVSDRVWEARQPQDFVKGVDDNQSVPYARPRQPNTFVGTSTQAQFEIYKDNPLGASFDLINGCFTIYRAATVVSAANFPSGF